MARETISIKEARRIALGAQGFDRARPRKVTADAITATIRGMGHLQIDFVNVVVPSHYQVIFSRLGAYPRALFDEVVYRSGHFTEQWAHEASIIPMQSWPLLGYRMKTHRVRPYGFEKYMAKNPDYVQRVLEEVRTKGPLTADAVSRPAGDHRIPGSWFGSIARAVLEAHFGRGVLAIRERLPNFARVYDLAERLIPATEQVEPNKGHRELLRIASRAHGIATAADLAQTYQLLLRDARPRIAELVEEGEIQEVRVDSWREPAYLHREAHMPKKVTLQALLSPFDPLISYRPRALRMFDFDYRFEIFVPEAKRRWGCYVLPFLMGENIVARVDLKAERTTRSLAVLAAYLEKGVKAQAVVEPLAEELKTMAKWLELRSVTVTAKGLFGRALRTATVREPW